MLAPGCREPHASTTLERFGEANSRPAGRSRLTQNVKNMNAFKTTSALLILTLCTSSVCRAEAMALTGKISDLERDDDAIAFSFTGHISFPIHGKTYQKLRIEVENIPITVRELENSKRTALEKEGKRDLRLREVSTTLDMRLRAGGAAVLVIVSPVVHFSEDCAIEKIETQRIGVP